MGFQKRGERGEKWTGRDLNPRLPRCERGDHTELIYRPVSVSLKRISEMGFRAFGITKSALDSAFFNIAKGCEVGFGG